MLKVENISVFYDGLQALWEVSIKVDEGEVVGVIGSNGAGKTTLLKTISGLLSPRNGSIKFLDKQIDGIPPHNITKLGITQIPEGRALFPYMNVMENLEIGAYIPEAREKKEESLERVFQLFPILKERKGQLAWTLSGGEQQMLAIGRGLMTRPKLMMFDEPSLGLAPRLVLEVLDCIKKIREDGITVLMVEQNVRHALEIADRGYVLETGRITIEGKGDELLRSDEIKKAYLGL